MNRRFTTKGAAVRRRGYALIASLMAVFTLSVLGASLLAMASTSARVSRRRRDSAAALHLAVGVADQAVHGLKNNKNWGGYSTTALGPGTVNVTVATPSGNPNRRIVTASATVSGGSYSYTRGVRATLDLGSIPPVFYYALAAKNSFTINGNVSTASYPTTGQGNVHCNQDVTITGTSGLIDGRVTASGVIYTSGTPTVTGGMTSGVTPMQFPDIDSAFESQSLVNGITVGSVSVSDGSLIKGKIAGSLTISGSGCQISGVVWVTGSVNVSGPVTGTGTLVCDGTMNLGASNTYAGSDTSNLAFMTSSTASPAITIQGNRQFKGLIYAPYGAVKINGGPTLYGGVICDTVVFNGNPFIDRWTNMANNPIPLPTFFQLKGWEEL